MLKQKNILDEKVRTRTAKELEVRKYEFLKICNLLDKLEIRYFLQGGVLLGAIRHNGFIPWDWDAELSVFSDEVNEKMDLLIKEIKTSGFVIEYYSKELSKLKIDFVGELPRDVTRYTIMGWNHNKKEKIFWRKQYKIPDHFLINMKKIKLFDKNHFAHYPPEKYLEYQYGDWKKPLQTSNKYIYMRKEYSGMNFIRDTFKKIVKKFFKFDKKDKN
tara:strand:+ start:130 stop:777 length:648 start_codon:yes stop_codon:yes gene_type:complete